MATPHPYSKKEKWVGFVTTTIESEKSGAWEPFWEYSWFSAANGDIVAYVTTYSDGRSKYVCIAAGSDDYEEDVYKIRVEGNDYVSLRSDVRFKSGKPAAIEPVASLSHGERRGEEIVR